MGKLRGNKDIALHIIILILCITPVILSFFLFTDSKSTELRFGSMTAKVGVPCIFKALTGYRCPACGMTRAFIYMSHLGFASAWRMNRAGVLLYVFCLLQLPYRLLRIFKPVMRAYCSLVRFEAALLVITGVVAISDFTLQFF